MNGSAILILKIRNLAGLNLSIKYFMKEKHEKNQRKLQAIVLFRP